MHDHGQAGLDALDQRMDVAVHRPRPPNLHVQAITVDALLGIGRSLEASQAFGRPVGDQIVSAAADQGGVSSQGGFVEGRR